MRLDGLLVTGDAALEKTVRRAMAESKIGTKACNLAGEALAALAQRKFDAVIVDCDDLEDGRDVIEALRAGKSNQQAIAFAVVNGKTDMKDAYAAGANFVLTKPVTQDQMKRSLIAARGLIQRERTRYARFPLTTGVQLTIDGAAYYGQTLNLSLNGFGVRLTRGPVKAPRRLVDFQMRLPGARHELQGKAEVAWLSKEGDQGLKFVSITPAMKEKIVEWVFEQAAE